MSNIKKVLFFIGIFFAIMIGFDIAYIISRYVFKIVLAIIVIFAIWIMLKFTSFKF